MKEINDKETIRKPLTITFHGTVSSTATKQQEYATLCLHETSRMRDGLAHRYDSVYASLYAPFDDSMHKAMITCAQQYKKLEPAMLIIIGIGGSNLGAQAIQAALDMPLNEMLVRYADTVDSDRIQALYEEADCLLRAGEIVVLNIITKSGTTTETIANSAIFTTLLESHHGKEAKKYIIVTTDTDSPLETIASQQGWHILQVPKNVGGRYAVFSPVGLFPLALMGVDIKSLLDGARDMITSCFHVNNQETIAIKSAIEIYTHYMHGFVINNFFPFSVDCQALGLWYRQLVAESLGKEYSITGKTVNTGITPTISIGSTDLHSIVELHLSGPQNTYTEFLSFASMQHHIEVPAESSLTRLVPTIAGQCLKDLMEAMLLGTQRAYTEKKRPYMTILLPEKASYYIGQYMQWKMLEVMYLGALFGINPYIQPNVELYKKETRTILAKK